jgi:hypothetical protein
MSGVEDTETERKSHKSPYTPHNPVPTVQKYRQEKHEREEQHGKPEEEEDDRTKLERLGDAYTTLRHGKEAADPDETTQPYKAENKNFGEDEQIADDHAGNIEQKQDERQNGQKDGDTAEETTEGIQNELDPKKARKAMKKFTADGTERQVTDPVTHLPVEIHDFTDKDVKTTPQNGPPAGSDPKSATGAANMNKSDEQLQKEQQDAQDAHTAMESLFPPPDFQLTRGEITRVYKKAMAIGLGVVSGILTLVVAMFQLTRYSTGWSRILFIFLQIGVSLGVSAAAIVGIQQYTENRIKNVWETEVWQAERQQGKKLAKTQTAESAQWLNSLVASVWPLINPDLFTSISDTLEVRSIHACSTLRKN